MPQDGKLSYLGINGSLIRAKMQSSFTGGPCSGGCMSVDAILIEMDITSINNTRYV